VRKALRYRLFGIGKMPETLHAAAAGSDVLVASEGLPVRNHVHALKVPGARVSSGVRTASGAIVILPRRLLASIGKYVVIDTDFSQRGEQQLAIDGDGLRITFDVATVMRNGSGSVEVRYRLPLDAGVLSRLPATEFAAKLSNASLALLNPWIGSYGSGKSGTTVD
jgi:hypothetical protein